MDEECKPQELRSLDGFGQLSNSTMPISSVFIKLRYSDLQILSLLLEGGSDASAGDP